MLQFVENIDDIIENIKTLEHYLNSEHADDREFAIGLVKKGRALMAYKVNGKNHFGPGNFLGFKKNSKSAHIENEKRETRNGATIYQALLGKPFTHAAIDKEFKEYADTLKGQTMKGTRKYWRVRDNDNKYLDLITEDAAKEETAAPAKKAPKKAAPAPAEPAAAHSEAAQEQAESTDHEATTEAHATPVGAAEEHAIVEEHEAVAEHATHDMSGMEETTI